MKHYYKLLIITINTIDIKNYFIAALVAQPPYGQHEYVIFQLLFFFCTTTPERILLALNCLLSDKRTGKSLADHRPAVAGVSAAIYAHYNGVQGVDFQKNYR